MSRPLVAPGTRRVGLTRTAPSTAVIGLAVLVCGGGSAFAQEAPPTEPVPDAAPVSPPPEPEISDRPDNDPEPPRMARTRPPPRDEVYVVEPNAPPPPPCATCGAEDDPYPDLEAAWLQVHAHGGWASLDGYELSSAPSEDAPDPLADRRLELDGEGATLGGGARFGYTTDDGVRFGAGFGGYVIDDLRLRTEPLPGGVAATIDEVVAVRGELALGKAFDVGPVWPYVDAVVSVTAISASLRLDTPQHGFVGETTYLVPSATVAPRIGVFVPLSDTVFIDVAGQYGLFGAERGSLLVGLGIWDD